MQAICTGIELRLFKLDFSGSSFSFASSHFQNEHFAGGTTEQVESIMSEGFGNSHFSKYHLQN